MNGLNELTNATRSGTLTVVGATTSDATDVTVNSLTATLYSDRMFAKDGFSLSDGNNTFTAVAEDSLGREDTQSITAYLPATNVFVYDLNGNLLSDGKRGFEYDDENQLSKVTVTNAWKSEFTYDGKMRRRIRKEYGWQSSAWMLTNEVRYVYEGNLVIQERDANNLTTVTYTRGNDLSGSVEGAGGIGGLLARSEMSNLQSPHAFYHADGNGNVTCLINTNQVVVARYLYDPYGNILSAAGPLAEANLYRFSSKEYHPNSGLVYYLYRHYEPNLQRWMNRDPIGETGGMNLYSYVWNDPVDSHDPWGEDVLVVTPGKPQFPYEIGPPEFPGPHGPLLPFPPIQDPTQTKPFPSHHASLDKGQGINSGNAAPACPVNTDECLTVGAKKEISATTTDGTCPNGKPKRCFSWKECAKVPAPVKSGVGTQEQKSWVKKTKCNC